MYPFQIDTHLQDLQPIRLSQLTAAIDKALADAFRKTSVWVIADVTNHTFRPEKNYHNFDLVEKDPHSNAIIARVQSKAWGAGSTSIAHFQQTTGQRFSNNISVLVNVSVTYHPVFGLQLNLNNIDINFTLGALEQERLATLARLVDENPGFIRKEGDVFITKNKELPLNRVIQDIAVISSRTSAGWQDFKHTLENNSFGFVFRVDDYFTIVQGENNAQQFLSKLIEVFTSGKSYDAVVIIRGGGAQTDFLIFDNYLIGKAVAKFPIPVITGIGHQKNETIADLMAHTQTKTPTKAAEFIIHHNRVFEEAIRQFQKTIVIRAQQRFSAGFQALALLQHSTVHQSKEILFERNREILAIASAMVTKPKMIVYNRLNDMQQLALNLHTFGPLYLRNRRGELEHFISVYKILSPENTLRRGFAIIKSNDRITSDPAALAVGQEVRIILSDKEMGATITSKNDYDGRDFNI